MIIESIKEWLQQNPWINNNLKFVGILLLAWIIYLIIKKIILRIIKNLVKNSKTEIDDVLFQEKVLSRVSYVAPLLVLRYFTYLLPDVSDILEKLIHSSIVLTIILAIGAFLTAFNELHERTGKYKERPIKGYVQIVKIIMYIAGSIIIIGILLGESPWTLLGGLGALTAVIVLIFRDTILSFVASIQISSYDLVKIGDWIEVPKFGADGDVIDISLNVIKVQNFDKTITVIPTYKLIEDSFKNWRGMTLSGGRRIKRSVYIDQSSIKFCTEEMLTRFSKFDLIKGYIKEKKEELKNYNEKKAIDNSELVNGRRMTNVGTFRAYLKKYLSQREDINKNLTFLIRQLPSGPEGLPIEIYVFANTIKWVEYEDIQSDIFDHLLAVIPQFELSIFQNPSGSDFKSLVHNQNSN